MIIIDKDKPINNNRDGAMRSTIDGKMYTNRRDWDNHLKANGARQFESGEGNTKRELQGDYNCRKELTQATREILKGK